MNREIKLFITKGDGAQDLIGRENDEEIMKITVSSELTKVSYIESYRRSRLYFNVIYNENSIRLY